jgi:hypothetical protein
MWRQPSPKCMNLVVSQVQSNVNLTCLTDPSKRKTLGLGGQPSLKSNVCLTCLRDLS